eukprot:TRINITY_DN358_c0_g1_i2.p1 TRINITY_DN358_c0_g1~~TRINITY_DN358_c0_g1_i2.p1  ORF type:complete len:66 (-),score=7.50 TRINITY_DN358_c0_g1_i2:26-223(-)
MKSYTFSKIVHSIIAHAMKFQGQEFFKIKQSTINIVLIFNRSQSLWIFLGSNLTTHNPCNHSLNP